MVVTPRGGLGRGAAPEPRVTVLWDRRVYPRELDCHPLARWRWLALLWELSLLVFCFRLPVPKYGDARRFIFVFHLI
jgi:hypothetical protein